MSLERDGYNGPITFCCDECGELEETRCAEFSGAVAKVKSHGWKARKIGEDWKHYCEDCATSDHHSMSRAMPADNAAFNDDA